MCTICNVPATDEHLASKQHAHYKHTYERLSKGFRIKPDTFACVPCGIFNLSEDVFYRHFNQVGSGHDRDFRRLLRLRDWYCQACGAQCRSKGEWDNHISTAKHVKGKVSYYCTHCDYRTKLAHLVKQHEQTKKHLTASCT